MPVLAQDFLPVTPGECKKLGWDAPDFVYVSGDAYVDHPSFGHAIISRILEKAGYRVAMLCLPPWQDASAFMQFGRPKLGFLVTAGVIDSMVNHYTTAKKPRSEDAYAPGGKAGMRPDRATIVYCNRIRQAYKDIPILIGGVEASLRRFSHYDYWDDKVRHSLLVDSGATLLMYGMGERPILQCAQWVKDGMDATALEALRGICYMRKSPAPYAELLPSHSDVTASLRKHAEAFLVQYNEQDPIRGKALCQQQDSERYLVQNPPQPPLSREELDAVYELPFTRRWHPMYDALGGVPALEEVEFSIAATRGCFGSCSFCAITFHQGRIVTSRSPQSILEEAKMLTTLPGFKGYIHDVGGPTANFRAPACKKQLIHGACKDKQCLYPRPCKNMDVSHGELLQILRKMREIPKIKKVFIRSGLRYDYIMADKDPTFLRELCQHHVSGQLKVAPEHVCPGVLAEMGKPGRDVYDAFVARFKAINERLGLKQYLVPYLMSSHPGSDLNAAVELACYLRDMHIRPEQVQDFYPTPGTLSTCMFFTGLDPRTMRPVFVARTPQEKAMQRALLQYRRPNNQALVRKALRLCNREDLIGYGSTCLVPPGSSAPTSGYIPRQGGKPKSQPRQQAEVSRKKPPKRSEKWAKAKVKKTNGKKK